MSINVFLIIWKTALTEIERTYNIKKTEDLVLLSLFIRIYVESTNLFSALISKVSFFTFSDMLRNSHGSLVSTVHWRGLLFSIGFS